MQGALRATVESLAFLSRSHVANVLMMESVDNTCILIFSLFVGFSVVFRKICSIGGFVYKAKRKQKQRKSFPWIRLQVIWSKNEGKLGYICERQPFLTEKKQWEVLSASKQVGKKALVCIPCRVTTRFRERDVEDSMQYIAFLAALVSSSSTSSKVWRDAGELSAAYLAGHDNEEYVFSDISIHALFMCQFQQFGIFPRSKWCRFKITFNSVQWRASHPPASYKQKYTIAIIHLQISFVNPLKYRTQFLDGQI